jgi:hypothetical protein
LSFLSVLGREQSQQSDIPAALQILANPRKGGATNPQRVGYSAELPISILRLESLLFYKEVGFKRPFPYSAKYASTAGVRVPAHDRFNTAIAEFILASQVSLSAVRPLPRDTKSASINEWCRGSRLLGSVKESALTWFMIHDDQGLSGHPFHGSATPNSYKSTACRQYCGVC